MKIQVQKNKIKFKLFLYFFCYKQIKYLIFYYNKKIF